MSYQVLARKWRPTTFAELSGQEHVVTALTNSLSRGRLHHAYLLTGTRGVGKTTIARILAKSLNCLTGVTATPCGVCAACKDIDAGRFVDLLELDAASNTGIDNMREILDNARYAPTVGRYKVYLIDEVHMLSKAAFNSMLKTLEEPPEHVRFVLATTDPQKIPVTVLSRCLQFNLKPLSPPVIAARLAHILTEEKIAHEAGAVALIARAAQGSLRDGLSLLDQAIAFGGGEVKEGVVRTMLGTVDREYVYRIADALAAGDGTALLAESDALAARGLASGLALDELASLFHRIAVAQVVPAAASSLDDAERIAGFASRFPAETRAAPLSDRDPGPRRPPARARRGDGCGDDVVAHARVRPGSSSGPRPEWSAPLRRRRRGRPRHRLRNLAAMTPAAARSAPTAVARDPVALPSDVADWPGFVAQLKLSGMAAQLAAQTELKSIAGNVLTLALPVASRHLADKAYADKLKVALEQATGRKLLLAFEVGAPADSSLAATEKRERAEARAKREADFRDEPFVRDLLAKFDGQVKSDTITPLSRDGEPK